MAITWVWPQSGDPFGPGFRVSLFSTASGPFESGSFWDIQLTAPADEEVVGDFVRPYASNTLDVQTWWHGNDDQMLPILVIPPFVTGQPAQLRVSLVQPTLGVADTSAIPVTMDMETGQTQVLEQYLLQTGAAAGQGLTTEEHNAVLQTNVGVIAMASLNPLDLVGDLASAFSSNPPLAFGSLSTTYTLTGDGEMPDIGDLFHTKLAIYFVATIPWNLSHRHGQSEEYPARLIQWRTVHSVGGLDMVTEVADFDTHGELWKWKVSKPSRIEYSVLPGVVVAARWWQFP